MACRTGGIAGLARTLFAHLEAVEADFQQYYTLDLEACLWGPAPIGFHRLTRLIRQLPPDARLHRATRRPRWTTTDELLATLCELIDTGNRWLLAAHGVRQLPEPLRIRRPGDPAPDQPAPEPASTIGELRSMFGGALAVTYHPDPS